MAAKKKNELVPPETPGFLGETDKGSGFEEMSSGDVLFPRLRIVQPSSDIAAEGKLSPGIVYEDVGDSAILEKDEMTEFLIAFWFKSWVEWGDIDSGEGIIETSSDPKSALAARCARSEKKETNKGPQLAVTEYHNFIVMLRDEPGKLYQLSCFRTGHKHGRKLLNMARMREKPIYAGCYTLSSDFKQKDAYKWYEWAFDNSGWVTEEEFEFLKVKHDELRALHETSRISYVVEDGPVADSTEY